MGISPEHLIEMILTKATVENDMDTIVDSITNYVEFINSLTDSSREMLEPIVQILSWITFRLPKLLPNETEMARADYVSDGFCKL